MKIKIFVLSLLVLVLTGCSASYDITINSDNIIEDLTVTIPKNTVTATQGSSLGNINVPLTQNTAAGEYYNSSLDEDNTNYYLNFNYTHTYDSFQQSYFATRCYQNISLEEDEDYLTLSTSEAFLCLKMEDGASIENATINIKTDFKVIENNADRVNDNVYTWDINENNYQNKPIYLQIEKIEDNALASAGQAVSDLVEEESSLGFVFIVVILAVLVLIVALFIKHKRGKVNRF